MKIFSVVVAYHPNKDEMQSLCRALRRNGSEVVVVDNTEDAHARFTTDTELTTVLALGENTGIAHAFNAGIEEAMARGADVVVLFDQDSLIDEGFLAALVAPLEPGRPGVAAPLAFDKRSGAEYPSERIGACGIATNVYANGRSTPFRTDLVISSGCAATAATFSAVGLMDEDLFIDFVDYEWCFRCKSKDVPVCVVPAAVMRHAIGDTVATFGVYRGIVHGPVRTYYKIRNAFLLLRKRHVPRLFAARQIGSAIGHNLIQLAFVRQKRRYLETFAVALLHGVLGVTGKRTDA